MHKILFFAYLCTSCQHYCLNSFVESDCEARNSSLQKEITKLNSAIAKLKNDIAKDRIAIIESNEARCGELFH